MVKGGAWENQRKRVYQATQQARGLCQSGDKNPLHPGSKSFCTKHLLYFREYNRKTRGYKKWTPGAKGRAPLPGVE